MTDRKELAEAWIREHSDPEIAIYIGCIRYGLETTFLYRDDIVIHILTVDDKEVNNAATIGCHIGIFLHLFAGYLKKTPLPAPSPLEIDMEDLEAKV